jgi:hypothetical protein
VDQRSHHAASSPSDQIAAPSFEELAAQQGVAPLDDFDLLMGNPSPEDESAEAFSLMLREWRSEGRRNGTAE